MDCFSGVAVRRDVVKETVSRGEGVLGGRIVGKIDNRPSALA